MIYLCLGRREQGKTTLALYLTRTTRAKVLFDPRGLLPVAPNGELVTGSTGLGLAFDAMWERHGELVVTPEFQTTIVFDRTCRELKRWVKEPNAPPVALLVDELRFVDTSVESFDWLCRCATRAQINIICTAHRPTDVKTDLRAIADVWCLFQTTQEHDLDLIEERCNLAVRNAVQRLKPREFIVWDDTRGVMQRYTDPAAWYVPLKARTATIASEPALPPETKIVDNAKLFE